MRGKILTLSLLLILTLAEVDDFTGSLTFNSEGTEGGQSHSRVPHWPGGASGVTIGRGYDLKDRSKDGVKADLVEAGLDANYAERISLGAGKHSEDAKNFVEELRGENIEITQDQQRSLFDKSYSEKQEDVGRLLTKSDVAEKYGKVDLDQLSPNTLQYLTDLHFRGDFTPEARSVLVPKIVESQEMGNFNGFWDAAEQHNADMKSLPKDRGTRRQEFITNQRINVKPLDSQSIETAHPLGTDTMNTGSMNADAMNADAMNTDAMNTDAMNADAMNTDDMNTDPMNTDAMNANPMNADAMNTAPMNADAMNANPMNAGPMNADAMGTAELVNTFSTNGAFGGGEL